MPSLWTLTRAAADPLARRFGQYSAYPLSHDEYIGAMDPQFTTRDARHYLERNAYEPQYLSAAKALPGSSWPYSPDELHELSYRRVPTRHPPEALGTRLEAEFTPGETQYHCHVFSIDDSGPLFFSHLEPRPDLFKPSFDPHRLTVHYRPTYDRPQIPKDEWTYLRGVTDLDL